MVLFLYPFVMINENISEKCASRICVVSSIDHRKYGGRMGGWE